ncbi:MAG: hypothetical protein L3K17_01750 [Thermoplasmata archaeon]|nr:hypothetical protein [Thermoplasmata archaeon]
MSSHVPAASPPVSLRAAAEKASAAPFVPAVAGGPRNVLADAPCNTSANSEVAEAYDATLGYLYDAWIGCGGIGFSRSVDGGYSFSPAIVVPGSGAGVASAPSVAVGANGTVYVGFVLDNASGDAPHVARSSDRGVSLDGGAPVFLPSPTSLSARDSVAVAPNGTLFLSWIYSPDASEDQQQCSAAGACWFTAGDLNAELTSSSDAGSSWSAPTPVNPNYPDGGITAAPFVVAPDGTIDMLLETSLVGGAHTLGRGTDQFVRSTDGGSIWANVTPVSNLSFPSATGWVDGSLGLGSNGTVYAAFDATNGSADDAYAVASTDNGTSWSPALRLNPDNDLAAHGLVTVVGAANGTAHVAWLANNSSVGWSVFAADLASNGTLVGAPLLVSDLVGLPSLAVGGTLGVVDLGVGAFAVSWSYGVTYARVTDPQVFSAVLGEIAPVDAPTLTSVIPGEGQVTVGWLPPSGPNDRVAGFVVVWGLLNQRTFYNLTFSSATSFAVVAGLPVDYAWYFEVAATNGAGAGPVSTPINVTLTAWGVLRGNLSPANATLTLDGIPVTVTNGSYLLNTTIGLHLVVASAGRYAPYSAPTTLPWNGTVWLNLSLRLLPGEVEGDVLPVNASVLFDGRGISVDSVGHFDVTGVDAGTHVVSADFVGDVTVTHNVTVVAGDVTWINLTLARANGTLHLTVIPAMATVSFAGHPVSLSTAGQANVTLGPGTYVLNVTAPGFLSTQENVTIASTTTDSVSIVLLKAAPPPGQNGSGTTLPLLTGYLIVIVAIVVVAAVGAALLIVRRRRNARDPGTPPALWETDSPDGEDETAGSEPAPPPAEKPGG